jgi:hypothetical protein
MSDPPFEAEEVLAGGNLSTVVRIGDTVRRPAGAWTPAVHALLSHLESKGFDAAPRAIGIDDEGREILSFVPGESVGDVKPWPDWVWSDATLVAVAEMLRAYHDAVRDFVPPQDRAWRLSNDRPGPGEIICHNDVAPYNLVKRPGGRLAWIDWDVAGPGPPEDDVAFAACAFVPMHPDTESGRLGFPKAVDRPARLRRFADAYGLERRENFVDHMRARLQASIDRITGAADAGDPAFKRLIQNGGLDPVRAQQTWIEELRHELERALAAD